MSPKSAARQYLCILEEKGLYYEVFNSKITKLRLNFSELRMSRALCVLLSLHLSIHHYIANQALQCKSIDVCELST